MTKARFDDLPVLSHKGRQPITPRQRHILRLIRDGILADGRAPTLRQMMAATGVVSPNGIKGHLAALRSKGYIEVDDMTARGIRLVGCRLALEYDAGTAGDRLREALEGDGHESADAT